MWQTLRQEQRKAQKKHQCTGCFGPIYPGGFYDYLAAVDSGNFAVSKFCTACQLIDPKEYDYEYTPGELIEFHNQKWPSTRIVTWTYKNPAWNDPISFIKQYQLIKYEEGPTP